MPKMTSNYVKNDNLKQILDLCHSSYIILSY